MNFFNTWLQGIIVAVIITTIIEMIIPEGNSKKYIKMILGVYIIFNVITPIINKVTNDGIEISSVINLEKYTKDIEEYKTDNKTIEKNNENNIKQIYIENIEKDMKNKLEERGYNVEKINVQIEDDNEYKLKQVNMIIREDTKQEKQNINENGIQTNIKNIEMIDIQVKEDNNIQNETLKNDNFLTQKNENEIRKYISSVYEIKEKMIFIN